MRIYHYTGISPIKKANAALMMCVFQIIFLNRTTQEALSLFNNIYFPEFRDASIGLCTYLCTMEHCLKAITRAMDLNWYNFTTFDVKNYEYLTDVRNGDLNWIIPHKLIAFSQPDGENMDYYMRLFKKIGITAVVKLNRKPYPIEELRKHGINHFELYFRDGSLPSESVIRKFLHIVENEHGAVAVHCKAGLGRAGTLITCYAMKHYEFPAAEMIAWTRLCRPGSILGQQQLFLCEIEETCYKWGEAYKKSLHAGSSIWGGRNLEDRIPLRRKSFDMTYKAKYKFEKKEKGQEKMLMSVKLNSLNIPKQNIDDRDAISPPVSYRKSNISPTKTSFLNKTATLFAKDYVSLTLASPSGKSYRACSL